MGVIKAAIEYGDSIDNLRQAINRLEDLICTKIDDHSITRELVFETQLLRRMVDWLEDDKEVLFEAIDKALEKR